jgi:hypothetical protein
MRAVRTISRFAAPARCASTAASNPALSIDWALIRSKMGTEAGKAEADSARDAFNRRLAAARGAAEPAEIDWAHYAKALPDIDVAKLRADYEKFVGAIPAITYDESEDKAAHEKGEAAWAGFETYCKTKVAELEQLQKEQQDHKLHRWYKRSRVWQRRVSCGYTTMSGCCSERCRPRCYRRLLFPFSALQVSWSV